MGRMSSADPQPESGGSGYVGDSEETIVSLGFSPLTGSHCLVSSLILPRPKYGPNQTVVGHSLVGGPRSVSFVARWVIRDSFRPDLEDTGVVTLHLPDQLVNVLLEQLYRLELMAPK